MIYFAHKILKPEDMRRIIVGTLKMIIESYEITNWKNREYMKFALRKTKELIDKDKDLIK